SLFRFGWLAEDSTLVAVFHHLVFDGASVQLFIDELSRAYRALRAGQTPGRVPVEASFADFVARQRRFLEGPAAAEARDYARTSFADAPFFSLPAERVGAAPSAGVVRRVLPPRLREDVEKLAKDCGVTSFMVLLATFELLLGRQAGLEDVSVGIPISLRMDPAIRNRVGIFVNPAVIRVRFGDDPSFSELLARVKEACIGAFRHQRLPFAQVVEAASPERAVGQNPLFSVMFILQQAPVLPDWPELRRHRELLPSSAKFPLTGSIAVAPNLWELSLEYRADQLRAETVEALAARYEVLLDSAVRAPGATISSLEYLSGSDRVALNRATQVRSVEGRGLPLHLRYDALVAEEPEKVVIRGVDGTTW
ncbi:MAG: condensation domain-containing protein, partial [Myxococcota bacterium]